MFAQLMAIGGSLGLIPVANAQDADNADDEEPAGSSNNRLESVVKVTDFTDVAKAKLPKATFEYITTGSCNQLTLAENMAAFERMQVLPPLLRGVSKPDPSTTVLGQKIKFPVMLAPVAGQRMFHPQGALAAARAATNAGTIMGVSSSVLNSVEEVGAASDGPKWFQLYMPKNRTVAKQLVQRVEKAGFNAIILTVDLGEWKDSDHRNKFGVPRDMLYKHLRDIGFPVKSNMSMDELTKLNINAWDLGMTWEIFDWLRDQTKLPILIKGVLRSDDTEKAIAKGVDGIVVSNHGGRRLDTMPASIDRLPEIVKTVDGRCDVLLDSGIRRGTDVLKALALGAKAVLIGRPYAWALAANGEAGVDQVLQMFHDEFVNAMASSGCQTVAEIDSSLLVS